MGTSVEAPQRNIAAEGRETLQAQVDLAPDVFEANKKFAPQYAQLDFDIAAKMAPQIIDFMERHTPQLEDINSQALRKQREADVAAVAELGPEATRALLDANPQQRLLLDELNQQALSGLQGGGVDPGIMREIQQLVRSGQTARGLGFGSRDVRQEATFSAMQLDALRRQNQQFAQAQVQQNQAVAGDPFMAVLGRPGQTTTTTGGGVFGQAQGLNQGQAFDPFTSYGADLYSSNQNATAYANAQSAANKTALIGAGISAVGSIAGGGLAGGAFGSDRKLKEAFVPVDYQDVLTKIEELPVSEWSYKNPIAHELPEGRHIGPMAQDFRDAFGLGNSDTTIDIVDAHGVTLAAIKALIARVHTLEAEVRSVKG
jgi:hypothetical protein